MMDRTITVVSTRYSVKLERTEPNTNGNGPHGCNPQRPAPSLGLRTVLRPQQSVKR